MANVPAAAAVAIPAYAVPSASISTATFNNVEAAASLAANRTQEAFAQAAEKNLPSKLLPEYFTGKETQDAEDWMKSFERYRKMHRWTDEKAMHIFAVSMQGRALRWLNNLKIDLDDPLEWPALVKEFTDYFAANKLKLCAQLVTCRQRRGEPTKIYAERYLDLCNQTKSEMSDSEKAHNFVFGLQPEARKNLIHFGGKTIKEIVVLCEYDEVAEAFDDFNLTGGGQADINAVTATTVNRQPNTARAKEEPSARVEAKLDTVVNMLRDNTSSINGLTSVLQQAFNAAVNTHRPHLGQSYTEVQSVPLLYGSQQGSSYGNANFNQRRNRGANYCECCQRTVYNHKTETCFNNPNHPNYKSQPMGQQSQPSQQTMIFPQRQQQLLQQQQQQQQQQLPQLQQTQQQQQYNTNQARPSAISPQDARQQTAPSNVTARGPMTNTAANQQQPQPPNNMRTLSTIDFDEEEEVDPSCLVQGVVCGEVVPKILLDTGAAVSAISVTLFKRLKKEIRDQMKDTLIKLRSATKASMEVLGEVVVDLQLGCDAPRGNKCEITGLTFIVVRELSAEVILGRDILRKYFDSINLRTHQLTYGNGCYIQLLTEPVPQAERPVFNISLAKSMSIQPNSNTVAKVAVVDDRAALVKQIAADQSCSVAHMIASPAVNLMTDGVVTLDDGLYDVQNVANDSALLIMFTSTADYPIRLPKGTPLGKLRLTSEDTMVVEPAEKKNCSTDIAAITVEDDVSDVPIDHYLSDEKADNSINQVDRLNFNAMHINEEEKQKLRGVLSMYNDRFAENPSNPSRTTVIAHKIDTGDHRPIRVSLKRFSHDDEVFIEQKVEEMLQNGIISRSRSPWGFRPAIVLKSDSTKRFCVNYTALNRITTFIGEPMPNADTLFDCTRFAMFFSGIDLASGYWQVEMDPADREKTAFLTKQGLFHFNVMPFGLSTAPATFIRLMNEVFSDMMWKSVLIYFDDIVIFSRSFDEHLQHITMVMDRLRTAGLQVKTSKCTFAVTTVSFLGFVISAGGEIKTHPNKIKAIDEMPSPRTVTQLRSALGLTGYYRRFVKNYAAIAAPLYKLTTVKSEDEEKWPWTEECEAAFTTLKRALITAPILRAPNWSEPFIVYTDASTYAMGAVLAQMQEGRECVIRYWSRVLSSAQKKYSATEREALAIVSAIREFHCYLGDRAFTVVTDHQPLISLRKMKDPHGRIARWMLEFQGHTFDIIYRSGEKNHTDALSRMVAGKSDEEDFISINAYDGDDAATAPFTRSAALARAVAEDEDSDTDSDVDEIVDEVASDDEQKSAEIDPEIADTHTALQGNDVYAFDPAMRDGFVSSLMTGDHVVHMNQRPHDHRVYVVVRVDDTTCLLRALDDSTVQKVASINELRRWKDHALRLLHGGQSADTSKDLIALNNAQRNDIDLKIMIDYLERGLLPSGKDEQAKASAIIVMSKDFAIDEHRTLVRVIQPTNGRTKLEPVQQVAVPKIMIAALLHEFHDSPLAGHHGVAKTYEKIRERYYWSRMYTDITNYVKSCDLCLRRKSPSRSVQWPVRSMLPTANDKQSDDIDEPVTYTPFSEVVVDVLGPLTSTTRRRKYIVIFVDRLTRWPEAFPTVNQKAKTIALLLMTEIIPRYGVPRTLLSDQGSNFLSSLCKKVYKLMKIHKLQTSAYFPSANGLVERFNHTIVDMLSMYTKEKQNDWDLYIPWVLFAYRTAVNASTLFTPFYLLHGYEAHYPSDVGLRAASETFRSTEEYAAVMSDRVEAAHRTAVANLIMIDGKLMERNTKLHELPQYNVGEWVLIYDPTGREKRSSKLLLRWTGPYRIVKRSSLVNYSVQIVTPTSQRQNRIKKIHVYRMRRYTRREAIDDNTIDRSSCWLIREYADDVSAASLELQSQTTEQTDDTNNNHQ
jgi:hypothetical protein